MSYTTVGITGHRDLLKSSMALYRKEVYQILSNIKAKYKNLLILSLLADGADRVVVHEGQKLDIEYIAIIPFFKSLYKDDFSNSSKIEYDDMLTNAKSIIQLPLREDNSYDSIKEYGYHRNRQYQYGSTFMCNHSDILISMYDGIDNGLMGGTSDTIKYFLKDKSKENLYIIDVQREKKES